MASIDWQVMPSTMLYARVAKGFKSGGFNGRANSPAEATEYDPETVWSYEGGFKTTIANQLRFNGAVFQQRLSNFQARISDIETDPIVGVPGARLSVLNAGKLRIRGAELEAAWTPVDRLLIDGQLGYLDAKYKEFDDLRFPGGSRAFQTPAFAPKWTLRLGAQYGFDLGGVGRSRSAASPATSRGPRSRSTARSSMAPSERTTEVPGLFQNGYWLHDARIVWENAGKHFAIGLYGQNLTKRPTRPTPRNFPASAKSAPSITARRARSHCG